ncbi:MAG: hypothetical protein ACW98G_18100 [Candidatus Hodarchaeales archaeon]|jgi:hypothetical protein
MSSSENTCCQGCADSFSQSCGESCTASCEENCQESCNEACSDACSSACSNACSNATCTCGSTTEIAIFPLLLAFGGTILSSIVLGVLQAFDSHGPILITLFGSTILAVSLSGIRLNSPYGKTTCNALSNRSTSLFTTKIGRISFNHSHHSPSLIEAGHEFQIKNKYFCTGCYGLLVGSIISVVIGTIYILNGIHTTWVSILPFIVPLCFIPIMFRYLLPYKIPSSMKLIANSLLPIGCCLLLIYTDVLFYNWAYNVFIVLLIISAAYLRGIIAQIDNKERI